MESSKFYYKDNYEIVGDFIGGTIHAGIEVLSAVGATHILFNRNLAQAAQITAVFSLSHLALTILFKHATDFAKVDIAYSLKYQAFLKSRQLSVLTNLSITAAAAAGTGVYARHLGYEPKLLPVLKVGGLALLISIIPIICAQFAKIALFTSLGFGEHSKKEERSWFL